MQFLYGEDGLDVTQEGFVRQFGFQARNAARVAAALDLSSAQAAPHDAAAEAAAAKANRCAFRNLISLLFWAPSLHCSSRAAALDLASAQAAPHDAV